MRRAAICTMICGTASLIAAFPVTASNSQPLAFYTSYISIQPIVSQQPGITNPTKLSATSGCGWDASDYIKRDAVLNSALDPGAAVSDLLCLEQDWSPRVITAEIAANSPNMLVTIELAPGGLTTVSPSYDKRLGLWSYRVCVNAPTYQPGDPVLQTIPGSNGGLAVATMVKLTASNPSNKQIVKIRYDWGFWPGSC